MLPLHILQTSPSASPPADYLAPLGANSRPPSRSACEAESSDRFVCRSGPHERCTSPRLVSSRLQPSLLPALFSASPATPPGFAVCLPLPWPEALLFIYTAVSATSFILAFPPTHVSCRIAAPASPTARVRNDILLPLVSSHHPPCIGSRTSRA